MATDDSRLDEIRNIDYFLANLELTVEQGEIGRQVYDRLSAPYLKRRAELVAAAPLDAEPEVAVPDFTSAELEAPPAVTQRPESELEPEAPLIPSADVVDVGTPAAQASVATARPKKTIKTAEVAPVDATAIAATASPPSSTSGQGGEVDRLFERGAPPGAAPWASKRSSFSLGRWIAYAGAFLAIAAALVFAFRGWYRFPPIVMLAGLIGATVVLYADGEWLRNKLSLPVAGFWLMGAGSALFLLDGYAVIQWLNLSGPLPWAAVLLACSLGYWWTEQRIGNGWFGGVGAVFQVGFWWLLAYAIGLGTTWSTALLGVVAAFWAFSSAEIDTKGPLRGLARVLASGSIILSAFVAVAMTFQIPAAVYSQLSLWPIAAAAVSALAATVVFDRARPSLRGRAIGGQLPLFVGIGVLWAMRSQPPDFAPGLDMLAILLVVTAADAAYALWRGSPSFSIAAFIGWLMMWTGVAYELALSYPLMIAATAGLGVISLAGGIAVQSMSAPSQSSKRASTSNIWQVAGALTTFSAAVATVVFGGLPGFFSGWAIESLPVQGFLSFVTGWTPESLSMYLLVSAWVMVALILVSQLLESAWTAVLVILYSFVLMAHVVSFVTPSSQASWYALGLVLVAAAWSQARDHLKLVKCIPRNGVVIFARVMYVALPVLVLIVLAPTRGYESLAFAILLAVVAAAWLADALRSQSQLLYIPVPMFTIAAITVAVWAATTIEMGAISGSIAALGIAGLSLLGQRDRGSWAIAVLASSAATATVLSPLLLGSPGFLAIDLLLGAIVWAMLAWAFLIPEVVGAAVGLGVLAVAAFLAWLDPAPWVTITVLSSISALLLAPRVALKDSPSPEVARFTASVAAAGLLALGTLDIIGLASYTGLRIASASWSSMNAAGLGVALLITAAYVLVWTIAERAEIGLYIGLLLVVLGVLIGLDAAQVQAAEAYLVPVALYLGAMGILWSSRKEDRPVPVGTDLAVVMLGPVAALIISVGSTDPATILQHGFWALGLSVATAVAGLLLRTRSLVFGGITVLVADVLWLGRNILSGVPDWAWLGASVAALVAATVVYASREPIGKLLSGPEGRFESWR